jgi:hypothetical protein
MKLFLRSGLAVGIIGVLTLFLNGCVKINDANVSATDFRSPVKFVDLVNTGTQSVSVVGSGAVGTLNYGDPTAYISVPSGPRKFVFVYGSGAPDTLPQPLVANYKYSFFSIRSSLDTAVTYALFYERNTYAGTDAYVPKNVLVRFINLSNDTSATISDGVSFHLKDTSSVNMSKSGIAFLASTPYYQAPVGKNPSFVVLGAKSDTLVPTTSISSEGRYSVVLYGLVGSLNSKILKED